LLIIRYGQCIARREAVFSSETQHRSVTGTAERKLCWEVYRTLGLSAAVCVSHKTLPRRRYKSPNPTKYLAFTMHGKGTDPHSPCETNACGARAKLQVGSPDELGLLVFGDFSSVWRYLCCCFPFGRKESISPSSWLRRWVV